ncbi:hypothetical protein [Aphanothece sacrum]|uniref:Uncharacterized protein n=1 Tax=Aphanothece sacrum FPU1 TaxID=1920663 RepID=A0A401IGC2_APHSA|nr:hypothetical protein [Aphanothece sacrum]GBF80259.1 hypothetical protein AsFPU1_1660 [Aphanothece sacrum FPU1]GBF83664.1 hypothetical protein AsFPU3_0707 [Aphanothece sacrum FPU3]
MSQITPIASSQTVFSEDVDKQLRAFGISPEELSQQFTSLDLSLDEVAKKIASIGIPSIILVALVTNFGGTPLVTTLATSLAGTIGVIGDSMTGYGIEIILVAFYLERLKSQSLEELVKEIDFLPLTDALKSKLRDRLNKEEIPRVEKTITIVQD